MAGPSTLTTQQLIDYGRLFPWTKPALGLAGYSKQPALSFADDVMKKILNKSNPWKFNAAKFPAINTQPYQQDYPTNISQAVMGWLQSAVMVDINNTSAPLTTPPLTVVQNLLPTFLANAPRKVCWIPNNLAQTATWGGGGPNDPGPGTVYTNPIVRQGGGPGNNMNTAITDANGNILVVTTYGVTGNVPPTAPINSAGGTTVTDGTVIWTVADPNGVALRIDALQTFNSIVWQLRVLYQVKPPNIVTLSQNFSPIPDDLSYLVKQGFLAYCYKQSDHAKFIQELEQWQLDIQEALGSSDREYSEFGFYPAAPIQGGTSDTATGLWGYPGWPGWSVILINLLLYTIRLMG